MSLAAARRQRKQAQGERAAAALLAWYDANARALPWRLRRGRPDPYAVWLSEIMLQQTTVRAVIPYYEAFLSRWPSVGALAAAPPDDVLRAWAGLGYYSRARNLHACAQLVAREYGGAFPSDVEGLRRLPGVGAYTAAAIAAIAFDRPVMPVDGNVERVVARLHAIDTPLPQAKKDIAARAQELCDPARPGDSAQALMDLGATICTPKRPACALCPLSEGCMAFARGDQEAFPNKPPKKAGAMRRGVAFVALCDGAVLLRTRPAKGLLGGMAEVPTSDWRADFDAVEAKAQAPKLKGARWRRKAGEIVHVFTHFPLALSVDVAQIKAPAPAVEGMRWRALDALDQEALPTLMRKVLAHALTRRHREER